jgi:hypothetical protein
MAADCHMQMVLDGENWRSAIERHVAGVDKAWVHTVLEQYQAQGYTYLRDGGDKWGVCAYARQVAGQYGITYRIPLAPISKAGHYGGFIGVQYADLKEYAQLVRKHRTSGADFIKIMISGLMDFNYYGLLSEQGLPADEIKELIHIAHEEGMAVMAHANGARTVEAAAMAGVDSIEHGAYLDIDALQAMKEADAVWVPTVSTIGNLLNKGRFNDLAVERILESALENIRKFSNMGGMIAVGTDAGAWAVPHGCGTEEDYLLQAGVTKEQMEIAAQYLQEKFCV